MNSYLALMLAGAACHPATFHLVRFGRPEIAVFVVVVLAVSGALLARLLGYERRSIDVAKSCKAFAAGALVSQAASFAWYFFTYGYKDPKLSVGVTVSVLELVAIILIGALSIAATILLARANTSDG